jgi:hypothetical protein
VPYLPLSVFFLLDNISQKIYDVNMKDINKMVEEVKELEHKTDFVISWFAKKYNKTIFRAGNLNKVGCRTWERNGDKYICFFDPIIERYTTAINPVITYKRKVN